LSALKDSNISFYSRFYPLNIFLC